VTIWSHVNLCLGRVVRWLDEETIAVDDLSLRRPSLDLIWMVVIQGVFAPLAIARYRRRV